MAERPVRVFLIDDERDDYLLTRDLLADIPGNGFTLDWTADYDAGVRALEYCAHDVFLVDYQLGARNGLDLLREGMHRGCAAPVIMLTGQADRDLDFAAMQSGAVDYLVKGELNAAALERAIRYALWQKVHADERERRVRERTAELEYASAAQRAADERLRFALAAARMVAWEWDLAAGRTVRSANATEVLGIPPTSDRSADFLKLVHPDDRAQVKEAVAAALAGDGSYSLEFRLLRPDGRTAWVADKASVRRAPDGRPTHLTGVSVDITERKRAEEALRESERSYAALAELVPQLVWTTRPDGSAEYLNQRWYDYTGSTPEQMAGHAWAELLHPDDRDRTWRAWQEALRTGGPYEVEYRLRGAGGGYEWFLARGIPLKDAAGRVAKWFGTCTGIDVQKRAEEALRESDRRKDEFLATLAHELRNPLAPVLNAVHILRMREADKDLQWATDVLNRQVQQLSRLVDDLLDVSRISRGKIELRKERVDLKAVVARAVETSRPLIEARSHRLEVSLPAEPLVVEADVVRLAQVLWNLLNNAAKYTEEGGRVWLTAAREGGAVVVRVRDTGIGIPAEMLPRVFDLFTQVERGLDRAQGGLGIGLTLVRRLTEMHGGRVEAHSDGPGLGSEFVVRLPLAAAPSVPAEQRPAGTETRTEARGPRRILIVDDNRDSARSLATLLRLLGNEVRTAHDGPQALEEATTYLPGVVLLDIGLPGMNGYEVARAIRARPELGRPLLVAVTGYGSEEDRRRSGEAGFDQHLVKPVDLDALQQLLTTLG